MESKHTGITNYLSGTLYPFLSHLRYTIFILWEKEKRPNHIHHLLPGNSSADSLRLWLHQVCNIWVCGWRTSGLLVSKEEPRPPDVLQCLLALWGVRGSVYAAGMGLYVELGKHLRTHAWHLWRPPVYKPLM